MYTFVRSAICCLFTGFFLIACNSESLQVTFTPDNFLDSLGAWDNAVSLQNIAGNKISDSIQINVKLGRLATSSNTTPAPPDELMFPGMSRFQATITYDPALLEYVQFTEGSFFEQFAGGQAVTYRVSPELDSSGLPKGRLVIDISVPQSFVSDLIHKGDLVLLEFMALKPGFSQLQFVGGFGTIHRGSQNITGVSYYGGICSIVDSNL